MTVKRRGRSILSLLVLSLLMLSTPVAAQITSLQNPLPEDARAALSEARSVTTEALETYTTYRPDQPLFRKATVLGRRAVNLAPENPEALRFLAELYGVTGFYGPAFSIWQRFVSADGPLDKAARTQIADSGTQVGYDRYTQGNLSGALAAYRTVIRVVPGNARAQRWAGRILLEQDKPEAALPYWRRLNTRNPNDAGTAYFLELSRAGVEYGLDAARAFYGGVSDYEAGRKGAAEREFSEAVAQNPGYAAAWGYLGRLAFEAKVFRKAETAYSRASQLAPKNQTYSYFLEQTKALQPHNSQNP